MKSLVRRECVDAKAGIKVWLFGSALKLVNPNDIDLLIVFRPGVLDRQCAIELRKRLANVIRNEIGLNADIILLTDREAVSTRFPNYSGKLRLL